MIKTSKNSILFFTALAMASNLITAYAAPYNAKIYPLNIGLYVASDAYCSNPPNAALKFYNGIGINTAHTSNCVAQIISINKNQGKLLYESNQTCNDTGDGSGEHFTETQKILVQDTMHFKLISAGEISFKYCAPEKTPETLRNRILK